MKKKFIYGKIIHIILEDGKVFKSIDELDKYLRKHYKPVNEYLSLDRNIKDELLNIIWKKIKTNPVINYYKFIRAKLNDGYKPIIEQPVFTITITGKKNIRYKYHKYIPDIVMWKPETKSLIIIDIKSGNKKRHKSYVKKMYKYAKVLERIFNPKTIDGYIYYFKTDSFKKINLSSRR